MTKSKSEAQNSPTKCPSHVHRRTSNDSTRCQTEKTAT